MDEIYVTYVGDEHVDNHDYDDNTEDDHDKNNDTYARACNAQVNTSLYIFPDFSYFYVNSKIDLNTGPNHQYSDLEAIRIYVYIYIYILVLTRALHARA